MMRSHELYHPALDHSDPSTRPSSCIQPSSAVPQNCAPLGGHSPVAVLTGKLKQVKMPLPALTVVIVTAYTPVTFGTRTGRDSTPGLRSRDTDRCLSLRY
ncbi:hypothetical protein SprV_0902695700 [Sparganum proliferum]